MLRSVVLRSLFALAFCLAPALAHAQGGSQGSIIGSVFDQTGMPMQGVKISVTSDTQIGGAKVAYSNAEGFFRIVGLFPGTFELRATAPKLISVLQKDIKVGVSAAAEVTVIMEVQAASEEVKIVERAPIVSTTTAN